MACAAPPTHPPQPPHHHTSLPLNPRLSGSSCGHQATEFAAVDCSRAFPAVQVNAMALFHLLDFGSGFDPLLLAKTGKGGRTAGSTRHPRSRQQRPWQQRRRGVPLAPACSVLGAAQPRPLCARLATACRANCARGALPCPARLGADARETVQFGLLGMLMHGAPLESHRWLAEFNSYQVAARCAARVLADVMATRCPPALQAELVLDCSRRFVGQPRSLLVPRLPAGTPGPAHGPLC